MWTNVDTECELSQGQQVELLRKKCRKLGCVLCNVYFITVHMVCTKSHIALDPACNAHFISTGLLTHTIIMDNIMYYLRSMLYTLCAIDV